MKTKKNLILAILIICLIAFYIYLVIPMSVSWNVMGMEFGVKTQYQPFTGCMNIEITLFNGSTNGERCNISIPQYIQIKRNKENLQNLVY